MGNTCVLFMSHAAAQQITPRG